jgi:hypothetical protein
MAQKLILSPQSHVIDAAPEYSFLAAASISGSLDIVLLHLGHLIWFSIFFPFTGVKNLPIIDLEFKRQAPDSISWHPLVCGHRHATPRLADCPSPGLSGKPDSSLNHSLR